MADSLPALPTVLPGQEQPLFADTAPIPRPELIDYVGYISDRSSHRFGIYLDVIDSFTQLRRDPGIMASNRDQVVAINNGATASDIAAAQADALADQEGPFAALAQAFGSRNAHYLQLALAQHRLPYTQMLFNAGWFARAGGLASSMFIEKAIFGNPRPFITYPTLIHRYELPGKELYLSSSSFPSGHTNQATWIATLIAAAMPEYATQLLARSSYSGYNRIVLGVHYPLDIIAGRMTGTAAAADRWNDPKMRAMVCAAAAEIRRELSWRQAHDRDNGVEQDNHVFSTTPVADYTARMSYGFSRVGAAGRPMSVPKQAPDLLIFAFPELNYEQRRQILEQTAIDSGMPLDKEEGGSWQRLNLAAAFGAQYRLGPDGQVFVTGISP